MAVAHESLPVVLAVALVVFGVPLTETHGIEGLELGLGPVRDVVVVVLVEEDGQGKSW